MAVVLGTNAGFVAVTPVANPSGTNNTIDNTARATRDTSPVNINRVIEIGWYCDNATDAADFDVGIYDDNGDKPGALIIGTSRGNAKGIGAGWKKVTGLNIPINAETIYWIALSLANTSTTTYTNYSNGGKSGYDISTPALEDNWSGFEHALTHSIYAICDNNYVPTGTNMQINIGDAWKDIDAIKINIGNVWKDVTAIKINIGNVWKDVF